MPAKIKSSIYPPPFLSKLFQPSPRHLTSRPCPLELENPNSHADCTNCLPRSIK